MAGEVDNAAEMVAYIIANGIEPPVLTSPGPVDDAALLARYPGATALLKYGGVSAVCRGCGVRDNARLPVGQKLTSVPVEALSYSHGYMLVPGARVVPPAGWQEGSADQPMLCPACLQKGGS